MHDYAIDAGTVRVTSPAVAFMQVAYLIGVPALIGVFAAGGVHGQQLLLATGVVLVLAGTLLWWSFLNNIEILLDARNLTCIRRLGPLETRRTVSLTNIATTEIPPYSGKLLARLRDGGALVLANKYAHAHQLLPEVALTPADARGPVHNLRRIQALVEQRKRIASGV